MTIGIDPFSVRSTLHCEYLAATEACPVVGSEYQRVRRGEAFDDEDWNLPMEGHGYLENYWVTLSYRPIRDECGDGEFPLQRTQERGLRFERNALDVPFASVHMVDADAGRQRSPPMSAFRTRIRR